MQKPLPGWVKPVLEFGPVLAFFVAYLRLKDRSFTINGTEYDGFILVTAGFVPLILLSTFVLWRLTGKLSASQILTLVLVVVFGGLTVWLNDPKFIKMKPTILYVAFAAVLGFGLMRGRSYLKVVLGEALPMTDRGWILLTQRFCGFFLVLAAANEIVWRTMAETHWVYFKTFGLPVVLIVFMIAQSGLMQAHSTAEDQD